MLPRTIHQVSIVLLTATLGVLMPLAETTASAHVAESPPFETSFPQDPTVTRFSNDWGDLRSGGRSHRGNDLIADKMTTVHAWADGVVIKVATSPRAGRYLIVEHADGWETYYIHLNNDTPGTDDGSADWVFTVAPGVEEGAEVLSGQVLGWVGDSGNAEGGIPHTHFELHHHGRALNPYPYLVEAFERDLHALLWIQSQIGPESPSEGIS